MQGKSGSVDPITCDTRDLRVVKGIGNSDHFNDSLLECWKRDSQDLADFLCRASLVVVKDESAQTLYRLQSDRARLASQLTVETIDTEERTDVPPIDLGSLSSRSRSLSRGSSEHRGSLKRSRTDRSRTPRSRTPPRHQRGGRDRSNTPDGKKNRKDRGGSTHTKKTPQSGKPEEKPLHGKALKQWKQKRQEELRATQKKKDTRV